MTRIAVFDSGLGSLSIIKSLQKQMKSNIIYFADSKNFPYGKKSITEIKNITTQTIKLLETSFKIDCIIVASNTLSFTLDKNRKNIFYVLPPLKEAKNISKCNNIAILATKSIVDSNLLDNYIKNQSVTNCNILKINASPLVNLVESGKFYSDKEFCRKIIKKILAKSFYQHNIDVVTLSSTHLAFIIDLLEEIFPHIKFLDPSLILAKKLKKIFIKNNSKKNTIKIFSSGNTTSFENKLKEIGIKNSVHYLSHK